MALLGCTLGTIVYSRRVPPVPPEAVAKGVTIGHYVVLTTRSNEEDPRQ